ncbi:hypothetical protein PSV08DRAFT_399839 [Bipolaris maydis]|uniref:uncharacterized protein n=1 Tax=Cochliobolus heterostrophus TaxID=5016 RepID=UPI0024DB4F26|nr:hypothetical protein J3E73DRAFT_428599 [Bipolaris maydis]KAJ5060499.1 hypothetical protein J3E74DRAFT_474847 [Bipolaris maydis]KAJ6273685.1 hypothetical protein PSV08DRAFT_399839 [Bipolaris maydis]
MALAMQQVVDCQEGREKEVVPIESRLDAEGGTSATLGMSADHVSAKALSVAKQHNRPACSSHASWMAHRRHASSQHHGRTQAKQYNAPHRYPGQSSRPLQRPAASWSSDYISEPVHSDADDYINSHDPDPAPSPARYHERPSPMSSPYSPRERGTNNKPSYYTTPPRRRQQWPARYQTPSPSSDYIAQSARTEDDYIATPASRMPGAFVDDDDDVTPEYNSGYTQYRPDDSSPLQRSAPKSYDREKPPPRCRAAPKDYGHDPPRHHRHRDSDLTSSNWDRKHDTARTRSRSRSRSRVKHLQPHELENFHEARQFLERFRALSIKHTARPIGAYSSDEERDDARSLRSRHSSVSRERPATYISSCRNSSNAKSKRIEAANDAAVAWYRSSHRYKDDAYASSPERTTGFSQPPRQSRLDRYERRPSYKLLTRDAAAQDSDTDSLGRDPSTTRSYLSRPPSTTPSYMSRSRSRSRAPSTAPSYVSPSPSPSRPRSPPSFSRAVTTTHRRSSYSSDNGIGEGSDYLPSDDSEEEHARRHFSDDDRYERRGAYSDDNGVGEGSDYVSSDDDHHHVDDRRGGRYARGKMYSARERVREEDEDEEEHSYSKGWGVGNRGETTGGRRYWEGGVGI